MSNAPAILRTLAIYAICVPLAVMVGYMLTDPLDYTTFAYAGVLALVLVFPVLLRWHYPLMVFSINAWISMFFINGRPLLWLVMVALSLGISLLERAMNSQKRFISAPQISWPLMCMLAVVILTAKLNGGIGLHSFGSEVYGGKKYIFVVMGILSYFALTAHRIPPERANLYVTLFLLGVVTQCIGDLYPITPGFLHFIFWFFPPTIITNGDYLLGTTRLGGIGAAANGVVFWLMARYGLRGLFFSGKLWRPVFFFMALAMTFLGGFRIMIFGCMFVFGMLFFLEGLHRTRALLVFAMAGMLAAVLIIPLASHLPFTFQRSLAFLPLNLSLEARSQAESSSEWRFELWKSLLPQIPKYLLLGKGYAITMEDTEMMGKDSAFRAIDASEQGLAISGDYHSGPLSVVIPFGIWGVIAILWLMFAGMRVMYCNYRHGDESLRTINTYLWVYYLFIVLRFIFIFGGVSNDMLTFASMIGLSIALNGGVCRPAPKLVQAREPMVHPARILPRARPAFQR